jgi:dihydroxy-acid dehydratase
MDRGDHRGLKKDLTSYGDPAFSLFLRRAFAKAAGYSGEALERPIVGIANTHSDFNPCHGQVPAITEAVKRGVLLAGASLWSFPPSACTNPSRIRPACSCAI